MKFDWSMIACSFSISALRPHVGQFTMPSDSWRQFSCIVSPMLRCQSRISSRIAFTTGDSRPMWHTTWTIPCSRRQEQFRCSLDWPFLACLRLETSRFMLRCATFGLPGVKYAKFHDPPEIPLHSCSHTFPVPTTRTSHTFGSASPSWRSAYRLHCSL